MKIRYLLIIPVIFVFITTSCKNKKTEQEVVIPEVKTEQIVADTIEDQPVIEEEIIEPVPQWPKTIRVQKGEWIYDIARREYGNIYAWRKIYNANKDKISNPNIIYPGQELILPE